MQLPRNLEVHLVPLDGVELENVLVVLDIHADGRYYFGTLVGLTDAGGIASITAEEIRRDFAIGQQLFPMDYRVPLNACDSQIALKVPGGDEFTDAQNAASVNSLMTDQDRQRWVRAQNIRFVSTSLVIDVSQLRTDTVRIQLPVMPNRDLTV